MLFVVRFLIGGILIALLPVVASKATPRIAGLVAMIPAVTLFGFTFLGQDQGVPAVGEAARGSLLGLLAVFAFLATVSTVSSENRSLVSTLGLGVLSWLAVATVIVFASPRKGRE
jgi:uncharacterized membrane protein (GlpM family)